MAYVAISKALVGTFKNHIDTLATKELGSGGDTSKEVNDIRTDASLHEHIIQLMWGDALHMRDQLSKYSFDSHVDLQITNRYQEEGDSRVRRTEIRISNMKLPCVAACRQRISYGNYIELAMSPDDHPALAALADKVELARECKARWAKVTLQVTTFLEKCKSLNEALKLWPELANYTHKDYLAKVNEKAERAAPKASAAAEALKGIDMDNFKTSVVLARMAGGA